MLEANQIGPLLIAKRVVHGADTPIGHCCSNVHQMLIARGKSTGGDQRSNIDKSLRCQLRQLDQLCKPLSDTHRPEGS